MNILKIKGNKGKPNDLNDKYKKTKVKRKEITIILKIFQDNFRKSEEIQANQRKTQRNQRKAQ